MKIPNVYISWKKSEYESGAKLWCFKGYTYTYNRMREREREREKERVRERNRVGETRHCQTKTEMER